MARATASAPALDLAPGLRERKAAATRAALCDALAAALDRAPLAVITVEELAAAANVSRMTFFNYFPTKEHAGWHMMARWLFRMRADLARTRARGLAAIFAVADAHVDVLRHDRALLRLCVDLAVVPRQDLVLTPAEQLALAPDLAELVDLVESEAGSLGAMLMRFLGEARRAGELTLEGSDFEVAHCLGAVLNGAALMTGAVPDVEHGVLLHRHVRRVLGLGFGPLHGRPAAPAPRTPTRYQSPRRRPA